MDEYAIVKLLFAFRYSLKRMTGELRDSLCKEGPLGSFLFTGIFSIVMVLTYGAWF